MIRCSTLFSAIDVVVDVVVVVVVVVFPLHVHASGGKAGVDWQGRRPA